MFGRTLCVLLVAGATAAPVRARGEEPPQRRLEPR